MTITTVRIGNKTLKMIAPVYALLKVARKDYEADCLGMQDGGEMLTSEFSDYLDFDVMHQANEGSRHAVEAHIDAFKTFFEM